LGAGGYGGGNPGARGVGRVGHADLRDGERNTNNQEQILHLRLALYCKPCYDRIEEKKKPPWAAKEEEE